MRSETMLNECQLCVYILVGDMATVALRSGELASCRFHRLTCEVYPVHRIAEREVLADRLRCSSRRNLTGG